MRRYWRYRFDIDNMTVYINTIQGAHIGIILFFASYLKFLSFFLVITNIFFHVLQLLLLIVLHLLERTNESSVLNI